MAKTIAQIKSEMTSAFMDDVQLAQAYGFAVGDVFEDTFSKVSLESIFFFIVATAIWTLESLFDVHVAELNALIDQKKPHRLKWYRDKALAFQYGRALKPDEDVYDTIVESEKIVKYASALEYGGRLYVKAAKGTAGKQPLSHTEKTALKQYLDDIKDAGVVLELVSLAADHFSAYLDIYYDPMVLSSTGMSLSTGADVVRDAIKDFVENQIPFNGEYRNSALIDALQTCSGVVIPELKLAQAISDENFQSTPTAWEAIAAKSTPVSGYFRVYVETDLNLNFIAYQTISSV